MSHLTEKTGEGRNLPRPMRRVAGFWPYLMVLAGIALLAWPLATDIYEGIAARNSISSIENSYDGMAEEQRTQLWDEAVLYNEGLLGKNPEAADGRLPYARQLSFRDTDMIAHLAIPKLSVDLPIYHGTSENVLMIGVGHVEGSALPVGTEGGRCVLAAHSGMAKARMFDDIHLLGEGDRFVVWTLGRPLAYRVRESKVVLPEASEELLPIDGEDLVTLVTCVPYGVNTHRLLVTGERCEYVPDEEVIPAVETFVNRRTVPLAIGFGIILAVSLAGILARRRRRKQQTEESPADGGTSSNPEASEPRDRPERDLRRKELEDA